MRVIHNQGDQFYLSHLSTGRRSVQRKYLRDDTAEVQTAGNKASLLRLMKTIQAIHCYTSTAENKISYYSLIHWREELENVRFLSVQALPIIK